VAIALGDLTNMSSTTFYHSTDPITIHTKSGSQTTLPDLCKSVTPPCHLNPLLFNGHLQTFWTALDSTDVPIYYKRKLFTAEDETYRGTFAVDFVVNEYRGTEGEMLLPRTSWFNDKELKELELGSLDDKPMLVTLHGLSGGSHEIYLRHVIAPLVSKERGWSACVVNARGCAMSKITSPVLFNARATWDIRQVVKWLRKIYPNRPLFAIGYSLGANILTNVSLVAKKRFMMGS
jgi:predicted alpha/beta-fold hydrolase